MRLRRSSSAWTRRAALPALRQRRRLSRGKARGSAALPLQGLRQDIRRPHRHSAVRPALQGALAVLRRGLGRRGDGCGVCRAMRDCAEYSSSLAPPLPEGGSSSAGPSSRDRRGRRDLRAREPEGGAELDRKPRRRGGKARKRGLSHEQVPVLVAADRTGETLSCTLPILNAKSVTEALKPILARDALLVSDANRCYPPVAAALDIPHETINRSAGERVRGRRRAHSDGQLAPQPDQGLPAAFPGHRNKVPRQLPAVVSSHRTRRPPAPESLPDRSHGKTTHTICELSQNKSWMVGLRRP